MKKQLIFKIIFISIALLLPLALSNPFLTHLLIRGATYSIVIMGFTLFAGYTGQISLGHAAFFGLGGYFAGILAKAAIPFPLSLLLSMVAVGILGLIIGAIVLRTTGHYLALSSIAVAMIIHVNIINTDITGGPSGLAGIPLPSLFGIEMGGETSFYLLTFFFLLISYIAIKNIINSRTGDALRAIANNELAAESLGIPVFRYKVLSFTISTTYAALAGALFAYYDGYISPDIMSINISILFLIMAFIGGIGNIKGSIIGAFALTFIEEYARGFGNFHVLVYGLMLVIIILFMPKGLVELPNQLKILKINLFKKLKIYQTEGEHAPNK